MALINCYECQKQISNQAVRCPSCGAPVRKPEPSGAPVSEKDGVYATTQATGKSLKLQQAGAVLMILFGLFLFIAGSAENSGGPSDAGMIMMVMGFIWYIGVRIATWWEHG